VLSCSGRGGSRTRKAYRSTGFQPGPVAHRVALPFLSSSTPTRTRTRNLSLEARDDCPFHHRGNDPAHSGGQGSRTLISTRENRVSSAARQPAIRLPSEIAHQWTDRELNPDLQTASLASSRWTISPCSSSGPPGTRTPITWVQTKRLPLGPAALASRGPSGTRTGLLPYRGSVPPRTPTDHRVIPDGLEPSLSWLSPRRLRLWTTGSLSDRDRNRTCKVTRLSTSPLFLFAYPVVAGPGVAPGGPGL
jgi:hypothetical protein